MGVLTIWTSVRVKPAILILLDRMVTLTSRVAVGKLGRMSRGRTAWEDVVVRIIVWLATTASPTTLTSERGRNVGHLMTLLVSGKHHLLISPLGKLSTGWVKVRVLLVYLSLGGMSMEREGRLVGVLIERLVELLLMRWSPTGLLLLYGVRVRLLLGDWRGRRGEIVWRRRSLAGNGVGKGIRGGGVHGVVSWWVPVLRGENGHGLKGRERGKILC